MASFETNILLPTQPETLFDYLRRPQNAVEMAPPGTSVEIVNAPDVIEVGSRIEFDISGIGPKQRLIHEIITCDHPELIVEQQVRGPFTAFRHETELRLSGDHVDLIDRVEFQPPGGLVGYLLTESRILQFLESGYEHRHLVLQKLFK